MMAAQIVVCALLCQYAAASTIISRLNTHLNFPSIISSSLPSFMRINTNYLRTKGHPISKKAVYNASILAIKECQNKFQNHPWNCSTNTLIKTANQATPETAFLFAIFSASLAHSLATACSSGRIADCKCKDIDPELLKKPTLKNIVYKDEECMETSLEYGVKESRELLKNEKESDALWKLNKRNKEAGRSVLLSGELDRPMACVCHGLSGACAVKKCVRQLPPFHSVAALLKKQHERPVKMKSDNSGDLIPDGLTKPTKHDLVYMADSPNFCQRNPEIGVLGPKGRKCDVNGMEKNSCEKLCCGKGYTQTTEVVKKSCKCIFHYCCRLACKTCQETLTTYRCKY